MIVLSRKLGEQLVIDDKIIVEVVDIRGDKVRLGIETPPGMNTHRREVYDAIQASMANPAASSPTEKPTTVTLSEQHVALLDRLCAMMGERGGTSPSREQALGVILDGFEQAQRAVPGAAPLDFLASTQDEESRGGEEP